MSNLDKLINYFKQYTNNFSTTGIISLVIDILLVIGLLYFIYRVLNIKFKAKRLIIFIFVIILLFGGSYLLDFEITFGILKVLAFWSIGILVISYSQEIRHALESGLHTNSSGSAFTTEEEKMNIVNIICDSAVYLSERRIGALITLERSDNLDTFIDKAILIQGLVTEELLTSLFFVGSATHDGAVIIRKNKIMCAGAYLPSTDKYDVPKSLGTRHRAAIGVSEKYDAVTVIVSEETGKISITVDGIIQLDLSKDSLRELLSQYLLTK